MASTVLKTLITTPKGELPEEIVLGHAPLPSPVTMPKKALVFYYGASEAARVISDRLRAAQASGQEASIVEVSVDVGSQHLDLYQRPRLHETTLVRLNRLSAGLRGDLERYFKTKIKDQAELSKAYSWEPPRFLTTRLDILESAAETEILAPVDVLTFHVPTETRLSVNAAMLFPSAKVTNVRVFGKHQGVRIQLPDQFVQEEPIYKE